MNQQFSEPQVDGAVLAVAFVFYAVIILVSILVQVGICYVLYRAAKSIPQNYSLVSPGQAFFLLIPFFNLYWLFVYPKNLSVSFQRFLNSSGQGTDDCGEQLGQRWAIASIASIIPCLGVLIAIAALVFMIMYLVKVSECRTRALSMGTGMGNKGFTTPQFRP